MMYPTGSSPSESQNASTRHRRINSTDTLINPTSSNAFISSAQQQQHQHAASMLGNNMRHLTNPFLYEPQQQQHFHPHKQLTRVDSSITQTPSSSRGRFRRLSDNQLDSQVGIAGLTNDYKSMHLCPFPANLSQDPSLPFSLPIRRHSSAAPVLTTFDPSITLSQYSFHQQPHPINLNFQYQQPPRPPITQHSQLVNVSSQQNSVANNKNDTNSSLSASTTRASLHDDVDIVFNRLMSLEAFRKLHPSVIRNLCSYASIERIDKGVIVFRQGDDAINWYALLEGSVDVKVAQSGYGQKDGVTLCTLGVGTTFGASVMPGKSHSVSVVTSDQCTLLRVRRADFQEIFNEQSHLINNFESSPFSSFTSLNKCPRGASVLAASSRRVLNRAPTTTTAATSTTTTPKHQATSTGNKNQDEPNSNSNPSTCNNNTTTTTTNNNNNNNNNSDSIDLDTIDSAELSSQLMRIGWVLRVLMLDQCSRLIQNRHVYPNVFHSHNQHQHHQHHQQHTGHQAQPSSAGSSASSTSAAAAPKPVRQLMSRGSSSQLLVNSGRTASSAGRKVANYVASSLMRVNTKQQQLIDKENNKEKDKDKDKMRHGKELQGSCTSMSFDTTPGSIDLHYNNRVANAPNTCNMKSGEQQQQLQSNSTPVLLKRSMLGREMVDWLLELSQTNTIASRFISSRLQAISMWQVLLEQGIIYSLNPNLQATPGAPNSGSPPSYLDRSRRRSDGSIVEYNSSSITTQRDQLQNQHQPRQQLQHQHQNQQQQQHFSQFSSDSHSYYKFWFDRESDESENLAPSMGSNGLITRIGNINEQQQQQQHNKTNAKQQQQQQTSAISASLARPSEQEISVAMESLWWSLKVLSKLAADACFRLILSKPAVERNSEEVDMVFEELQQLKALSHLTNGIKHQLAACVSGEYHAKQNTVLFNQGETGHSWYIILRGSVNVVIVGKGVVCTLHDGDDFGKLALVNDVPRAATIVTNEPNCYFLRVDKHDFNTILRDVEANTVRLQEHGKEVLILQKVAQAASSWSTNSNNTNNSGSSNQQRDQQQQQLTSSSGAECQAVGGSNAPSQNNSSHQSAGQNSVALQQQQQQTSGGQSGAPGAQPLTAATAASSASSSSSLIQSQQTILNNNNNNNNSGSYNNSSNNNSLQALKYMVMAGTAEKMLEHLLETRINGQSQTGPLLTSKSHLIQHDQISNFIQFGQGDNFLEDFILTYRIFMSTGHLCSELLKQYQSPMSSALNGKQKRQPQQPQANGNNSNQPQQDNSLEIQYLIAKKRRVVKFVRCWMLIAREHFFQQSQVQAFLTTLHSKMEQDTAKFTSLQPELSVISRLLELHLEDQLDCNHRGTQRWIDDIYGNILPIRRYHGYWDQSGSDQFLASIHLRRFEIKLSSYQVDDELVFRVYATDHSYVTLRVRLDERAGEIKLQAAAKLKLKESNELILVHVKSNGERIIFNDSESNLSTGLSVNGRIFVCPLDHIDAISPIPDQDPFQEAYSNLITTTPLFQNNNNMDQSSCSTLSDNSNNNFINNQASLPNGDAAAFSTNSINHPTNNNNNNNSNNVNGNQSNNNHNLGSNNHASNKTNMNQEIELQQQNTIVSHLLNQTPCNLADTKTQMSLSNAKLEEFSSRDIAYCLTQLGWSLLKNMHEYELIYAVFGHQHRPHHASDNGKQTTISSDSNNNNAIYQAKNNNQRNTSITGNQTKPITANLNVFLRHFNEIQYWVVTQICLSTSLSKRAQILRKFIKIAAHCKELQNLNAFFAIIMGLSNMAVARLTQTWERLPGKLKRTFSQFESLIDPSRNHRRYRLFISQMEPPIVPFMPLFLKDMTFAHEGNKTYVENGLINFEKMQMVAQTLRTIRYCKSRPMKLDPSVCKFKGSIRNIELFFRDLKIIDNQRTLTQMSTQLEHRKT